ncbi:MAG: RNA polymerase sigma factor [Desulfovermiculus sp.]
MGKPCDMLLVRFEKMKYREAAEVLDVSLSSVRMRVYKGLLALKASPGAA